LCWKGNGKGLRCDWKICWVRDAERGQGGAKQYTSLPVGHVLARQAFLR
jgi:hypothetical protein